MPIDPFANTINDLIASVIAIETELGIVPAGAYANVRARLDILEARINNPFAPSPIVTNPFFIGNSGVSIQDGYGDPGIDGILAAPGSLYLRQDANAGLGLYSFGQNGVWAQIVGGGGGNGSISGSATTVTTATYAIDTARPDFLIYCNRSGTVTLTLPAPTVGRYLIVKDISGHAGTNTITINPHASEHIDGGSSATINTNYGSLGFTSDGTNWWIN